MILEMKNAYITALAKEMNITKAAVSPATKRLGRKGLVEKAVAPDNKSINVLHLTE
jgi:DNA-binding MarR family transcriptional regulator